MVQVTGMTMGIITLIEGSASDQERSFLPGTGRWQVRSA